MINIGIVYKPHYTALEHYRQRTPHDLLFHDDEKCFQFYDMQTIEGQDGIIDGFTDDQLKDLQIIQFIRYIHPEGKTKETVERLHKLGVKVVFDIDDHWQPDPSHLLHGRMKYNNYKQTVTDAFKYADWVTTTTPYFANEISQYCSNITVLPNCISPTDTQWKPAPIENARLRFGWVGGVFHLPDIELLQPAFDYLYRRFGDISDSTYQFCVAGFNENPEYIAIEKIMKHKRLSKDYQDYLNLMTPTMEHLSYDQPYRRIWSKDVKTYGQVYNELDVCLVPLRDTKFNKCKSELKIIEAGVMGKSVIVSDVTPYKEYIKDGENGLIATDWYTEIKYMIENPEHRKEMAEALTQTIVKHFNPLVIGNKRGDLYRQLAK